MSVRDDLSRKISELPGVVGRETSRRGHGPTFFHDQREIAHFHGEGRLDIRLTREVIRRRLHEGGMGPHVRTRGPSADWVSVELATAEDFPLILELVRVAALAADPATTL
jgi:hypothetical protein